MDMNYRKHRNYSLVYHYCSLATFQKIVDKSTIRLTNIKKSNDQEEITYLLDRIRSICKEVLFRLNNRLSAENKIGDDFIVEAYDETFSDYSTMYYVCCFSEEKDMKEQWQGYADDARGVSIGFSTTALHDLHAVNKKYDFVAVTYNAEDFINRLKTDFMCFADTLEDTPNVRDELGQFLYKMMTYLFSCVSRYKNPSFTTEREWRLIYNPYGMTRRISKTHSFLDRMNELSNPSSYGNGFVRKAVDFEIRKNSIRSFIDIDFSERKHELIKEIVIGNNANIDDADLLLFLSHRGFSINELKISKSKTPLV